MDSYRLPRHVRPTRYDLRLEPDLTTLTFTGDETVTLEVEEATAEIVLNAVDLAFGDATLTNARGESQRGLLGYERQQRNHATDDAEYLHDRNGLPSDG